MKAKTNDLIEKIPSKFEDFLLGYLARHIVDRGLSFKDDENISIIVQRDHINGLVHMQLCTTAYDENSSVDVKTEWTVYDELFDEAMKKEYGSYE